MELAYVSITVDDMERAIEFYTEFFGQEPEREDERLSFFQLVNTRFSLYNPAADGVEVPFGENCVPAFRVEDLESERERLEEIAPEVEDITDNGSYRLFHFKGPEGNMIEVFEGSK